MTDPAPTTLRIPADLDLLRGRIDDRIEAFISSRQFPDNLSDALRYAVLGGGKRIRPLLAWCASLACGGSGIDSIEAGIAVELIHAFSLVHDDLPALDNDELRRGRATLHMHASEAMAILAGDAMLSLAYEAVQEHADDQISHRLSAELARGTRAMIVGQVYDTLGGLPGSITPHEQLELIHRNKTGALLCAACRMGAISARAGDQQLELVSDYARAIGLQFQIVDDLLDILGSTDEVGKTLGKDHAAGKLTYPGVLGIDRSRELVEELAREASRSLSRLGRLTEGTTAPLEALGDLLTRRRQ